MNSDFRVSTAYFEHYKICKLKRRLGNNGVLAHLQLLAWTAKNKPEGTLNGMDDEDICIAAHWDGDADEFISMLTTLALLDKTDNGYYVHNWEKHNGYASGAARRSEAARIAAKAKWDRKLHNLCDRRTDADNTGCDSITSAVRTAEKRNAPSPTPTPIPYPSPIPVPTPTLNSTAKGEPLTLTSDDSQPKPEPKTQPAKKESPYQRIIDEWNTALGGKTRPNKDAVREIKARLAEGYTEQDLIDCVKGFSKDDWWMANSPIPFKMIRAKNIEQGMLLHRDPKALAERNNNRQHKQEPKQNMYGMGMITDMSKIPDEDCITPYDVDYEVQRRV